MHIDVETSIHEPLKQTDELSPTKQTLASLQAVPPFPHGKTFGNLHVPLPGVLQLSIVQGARLSFFMQIVCSAESVALGHINPPCPQGVLSAVAGT